MLWRLLINLVVRFVMSFFGHQNLGKYISSSSEFVLPLLKLLVADVFGKVDKMPDVFLLGSKLCGPWHRQLEAIDSLNTVRYQRTLPENVAGERCRKN